jgi:DNA-3-methyladenine glycosylase I
MPKEEDRMTEGELVTGSDGVARCRWAGSDAQYVRYHDEEWGVPTADDRRLFEKLCLEGFQSGLSWLTILRKRENFRRAFHDFELHRVARMTESDVEELLGDAGIVRHRGKIEAAIQNAGCALGLVETHGSLARYLWSFVPSPPSGESRRTMSDIPTRTQASERMSRELRGTGWGYVGPTTAYAFMQSVGMVNDHLEGCHRREPVEALQQAFSRP